MNNDNDVDNDLPTMEELIEEEELLEETEDTNMARMTFINALSSIINSADSNVRLLPLSTNNNRLREILQQSLYDKSNYKKVLSDEGNDQLKTVKFDPEKFELKECVITQEKFEKGQEVTQLPCGHIFEKEAIEMWLKEQSSKCPICRYELKFKEIKDKPDVETEEQSTNTDNDNNNENNENEEENSNTMDERIQRMRNLNNLLRQMELMYNPFQFVNSVNRENLNNQRTFVNRIISQESQFVEDRALQNAIMASIHEQNINSNDEYIEEEKNFVEDDIQNHPDFDFDTQQTFGDIETDSDDEI